MSTLADRVKQFEGYSAKPYWDYRQWTSGYGTRAGSPTEAIDETEAARRLDAELGSAAAAVDRFAPNLAPGLRDALTSLTYNAGNAWMTSGLGQAVKSGDMDAAGRLFLQYNKAGGEELPGLVKRRASEWAWTQGGAPQAVATAPNLPADGQTQPVATLPSQDAQKPASGLLSGLFGASETESAQQAPTLTDLKPADANPLYQQDMLELPQIVFPRLRPVRVSGPRLAMARAAIGRRSV